MNGFQLAWKTHRWVGLSLAAVFLVTAGTGLLLLWKKEFAYLQPPTRKGKPATLDDFLPLTAVWAAVSRENHPHFQTPDDIDRIDVRLDKRVYKVRSKHDDAEIQIDASTGTVLSIDVRRSDVLERIHDGSWIADGFKVFVMPLAALGLIYLACTGWFMWLYPRLRKAAIRRRHAEAKRRLRASRRAEDGATGSS